MSELPPSAAAAPANLSIRPLIYLEYGLDGEAGEDAACEICERGMRFKSRWQFTAGTMLGIAFLLDQEPPCRVEAEGMVIECARQGDRRFLTTLAFFEIPQELRAVLARVCGPLQVRPVCR